MEGIDINELITAAMSGDFGAITEAMAGIDFETIDLAAYDLGALGLGDWDPNSGVAPELSMELQCGTGASDICMLAENAPVYNVAGFQRMNNDLVQVMNLALEAGSYYMAMENAMTLNQLKAWNAFRCSFVVGGENFWYSLASVYYMGVEWGFAEDITSLVDEYYPWLCTCVGELALVEVMMMAFLNPSGTTATTEILAGCSEEEQRAAVLATYNNKSFNEAHISCETVNNGGSDELDIYTCYSWCGSHIVDEMAWCIAEATTIHDDCLLEAPTSVCYNWCDPLLVDDTLPNVAWCQYTPA